MTAGFEPTWIGKAFCAISEDRPEFADGCRGAYVVVACRACDIADATRAISAELGESGLNVRGFEHLFDISYLDRPLSEYEQQLISRLTSYPVQFENVHFFKADG